MPIRVGMRQVFNTSVGTVEVLVDPDSDTVSVYRFDAEHRPVAAAMESWRHVDLVDVLNRQAGVPLFEATRIAAQLRDEHSTRASFTDRMHDSRRERGWSSLENAGIPLRFVAVVLDALIVLAPLFVVVGLMSGGGYRRQFQGPTKVGLALHRNAILLVAALVRGY